MEARVQTLGKGPNSDHEIPILMCLRAAWRQFLADMGTYSNKCARRALYGSNRTLHLLDPEEQTELPTATAFSEIHKGLIANLPMSITYIEGFSSAFLQKNM